MKLNPTIYLLILVIGLSGCKDLKKAAHLEKPAPAPEEPVVQYIEDQELAKIILKPERKQLKISRDPFKPLITKETGSGTFAGGRQDDLKDVILIGVIKMDNEFRAYVKTGNKTGVLKLRDKIHDYTVEYIDNDQIILRSGDNEIVKKRGKK